MLSSLVIGETRRARRAPHSARGSPPREPQPEISPYFFSEVSSLFKSTLTFKHHSLKSISTSLLRRVLTIPSCMSSSDPFTPSAPSAPILITPYELLHSELQANKKAACSSHPFQTYHKSLSSKSPSQLLCFFYSFKGGHSKGTKWWTQWTVDNLSLLLTSRQAIQPSTCLHQTKTFPAVSNFVASSVRNLRASIPHFWVYR